MAPLVISVVSLGSGAMWMSSRTLPTNYFEKTAMIGVEAFLFLGVINLGKYFFSRSYRSDVMKGLTVGLEHTFQFMLIMVFLQFFGKLPLQLADCGPLHFLGAGVLLLYTIVGFVKRDETFSSLSAPRRWALGKEGKTSGKIGDYSLDHRASGGIPFLFSRTPLASVVAVAPILVPFAVIDILVGRKFDLLEVLTIHLIF